MVVVVCIVFVVFVSVLFSDEPSLLVLGVLSRVVLDSPATVDDSLLDFFAVVLVFLVRIVVDASGFDNSVQSCIEGDEKDTGVVVPSWPRWEEDRRLASQTKACAASENKRGNNA